MGKVTDDDKMRIQTLRELGFGYKAITAKYPEKNWKLVTVKQICRRIDERGSAVGRKLGSGRPKTARTVENIEKVEELICSQDEPGTSRSTRQIAKDLDISERSVRRIAKLDLGLRAFRRVPAQVISDAVKEKRLERSKRLLRRLTLKQTKLVFFTDEKVFYTNPPVNNQNNRVWSVGRKADVEPSRLLVERAKFAPHIMVSAGVCYEGKGRLHFVEEKAKVNASYYVNELLPKLIEDCNNLYPGNAFIFQQDGAPAHGAKLAQDWIAAHCPDFIDKDSWP
jgi:transposase